MSRSIIFISRKPLNNSEAIGAFRASHAERHFQTARELDLPQRISKRSVDEVHPVVTTWLGPRNPKRTLSSLDSVPITPWVHRTSSSAYIVDERTIGIVLR